MIVRGEKGGCSIMSRPVRDNQKDHMEAACFSFESSSVPAEQHAWWKVGRGRSLDSISVEERGFQYTDENTSRLRLALFFLYV